MMPISEMPVSTMQISQVHIWLEQISEEPTLPMKYTWIGLLKSEEYGLTRIRLGRPISHGGQPMSAWMINKREAAARCDLPEIGYVMPILTYSLCCVRSHAHNVVSRNIRLIALNVASVARFATVYAR
jgi:hypothetical protein